MKKDDILVDILSTFFHIPMSDIETHPSTSFFDEPYNFDGIDMVYLFLLVCRAYSFKSDMKRLPNTPVDSIEKMHNYIAANQQ